MNNVKRHGSAGMHRRKVVRTAVIALVAYVIGLLYFFPILYMFLTGMKTELEAASAKLLFTPTFETYVKIFNDASMYNYLGNSVRQVLVSTLVCLLLGVPAAFSIQFGRFKKPTTGGSLHKWFITTILLPPVAIMVPLYLFYNSTGLMKSPWGLTVIYVGFHLPIVVWMIHSFLADVPAALVEASEIDGCSRFQQMIYVIIPLVRTGIVTAGLLVAVFVWNEFFLSYTLTVNQTATLPVYMSRFREQQGQFTAQLSASSTLCTLPAIILGWTTQKSLVKGLTMGSVKG